MARGRKQTNSKKGYLEVALLRLHILGWFRNEPLSLKVAKYAKRDLGWPQTIRWPPFPHLHRDTQGGIQAFLGS
jgi:hypothetical protein